MYTLYRLTPKFYTEFDVGVTDTLPSGFLLVSATHNWGFSGIENLLKAIENVDNKHSKPIGTLKASRLQDQTLFIPVCTFTSLEELEQNYPELLL